MNYTKYKMRVKCIADSELFLSAISPFVDQWFVGLLCLDDGQSLYSIRHPWPDRAVTFTVSDELTPPMMRWILMNLGGLDVAAQTLQQFELYTGDRVSPDEVVVREPNPLVWHVIQHCLEQARDTWATRAREIDVAARRLAVPESLRTKKRMRSKDQHVDSYLKSIFNEIREQSTPEKTIGSSKI